jgi:hypothetical protein
VFVDVDLTRTPAGVALLEPEDLNSFKVVAHGDGQDPQKLGAALADVGRLADEGHVFVAIDAVRRLAGDLAQDPEWSAGLERTIEYARGKGWLDERGEALQAHVEWA